MKRSSTHMLFCYSLIKHNVFINLTESLKYWNVLIKWLQTGLPGGPGLLELHIWKTWFFFLVLWVLTNWICPQIFLGSLTTSLNSESWVSTFPPPHPRQFQSVPIFLVVKVIYTHIYLIKMQNHTSNLLHKFMIHE